MASSPRAVLDLLVPDRCAVCGRGERGLCSPCASSLTPVPAPLCARCGAPTAWPVVRCRECSARRLAFRTARAAIVYDEAARRVVAAWKEGGLTRLSQTLSRVVAGTVARPAADGVVFVPGDRERTLWRGHHAAEALARALATQWQLPLVPLLAGGERRARQRGLARTARQANVRGAFSVLAPAPASLVLVDDVYTTGATVSAAAGALRRAGARTVDVVTLARAVRR